MFVRGIDSRDCRLERLYGDLRAGRGILRHRFNPGCDAVRVTGPRIVGQRRYLGLTLRCDLVQAARIAQRLLHTGVGQFGVDDGEFLRVLDAADHPGGLRALLQGGLGRIEIELGQLFRLFQRERGEPDGIVIGSLVDSSELFR